MSPQQTVNDIQRQAEDKKDELSHSLQRVENENTQLKVNNGKLKNDLEKLRDEARNKSFSYKGRLEEEDQELQNLRSELEDLKQHYDNLELQCQDKIDENQRLQKKMEGLTGDFDAESDQMQREINQLKQEKDALQAARATLEARLQQAQEETNRLRKEAQDEINRLRMEAQSEINRLKQEGEAVTRSRNDLQVKAQTLEDEISWLKRDKDNLAEARGGLESGVQEMRGEINRLKLEKDAALRARNELEINTQSLHTRIQKLEEGINWLKRDKDNLAEARGGLETGVQKMQEEINRLNVEKEAVLRSRSDLEAKARTLEAEINWMKQDKENLVKTRGNFEAGVVGLQEEVNRLRRENETASLARSDMEMELKKIRGDLNLVTSEKDLLRARHDSLTKESSELQQHILALKKNLQEASVAIQHEREEALASERSLKQQFDAEKNAMVEEFNEMDGKLKDQDQDYEREFDNWSSEKRQLEVKLKRAEDASEGLRKTLQSLQQTEHTLQNKESKLADALRSETERHAQAEKSLERQIQDLQHEIEARKQSLDSKLTELAAAKEVVRQAKKAERSLQDQLQERNDEVELLSVQIDEEQENAQVHIDAAQKEVESLRQKLKDAKAEIARLENQNATAQANIRTFQGDLHTDEKTVQQLSQDFKEATRRLEVAKKERHQLNNQFVAVQAQYAALQAASVDVEIERDEFKSRLSQTSRHTDIGKSLNSEKMELRKAKSRLEIDLQHVSEERDFLETKVSELEAELAEANEVVRENEEKAWNMGHDLKKISETHEREMQRNQQKVARLDARIDELVKQGSHDSDAEAELSILRGQLEDTKKRESDLVQKEAGARKDYKELRSRILNLEQELRDARNAALSQSSIASTPRSARKTQEEELRRQLSTAQEQIREQRGQTKTLDRKLAEQKSTNDDLVHEVGMLEQDIADTRQTNAALVQKNHEATTTIGELKKKIHALERELQEAQFNRGLKDSELTSQTQILEERRELVEHLESQVRARDEEIRNCHRKEERELETLLWQKQREKEAVEAGASAAAENIERLTRKYERAVAQREHMRAEWDEERKAIRQRVKFGGNGEAAEKGIEAAEKRHQAEIMGLAKQIRFLKAKAAREASFRADLTFSKNFFLMQIQLYSSWYVPLLLLSPRVRGMG